MKKILITLLIVSSLVGISRAEQYIVGEGDLLKITVYEHNDLTTTTRVSGEGTIVVPLVGEIKVGSMSTTQISEKLAVLLADGYVVNPQISVFVEEYRSKKVIVLGQINKPGLYELRGQTTFLELISIAGGIKETAGDRAMIKRAAATDREQKDVVAIDMKKLVEQGDTTLNVTLQDGDTIYIDKAGVFYVTGEVKKPDAYKYEETTVIKAITMAGGLTDKASARSIRIIRKVNGEERIIENVKMDEPVLPDDVIVVPESFF